MDGWMMAACIIGGGCEDGFVGTMRQEQRERKRQGIGENSRRDRRRSNDGRFHRHSGSQPAVTTTTTGSKSKEQTMQASCSIIRGPSILLFVASKMPVPCASRRDPAPSRAWFRLQQNHHNTPLHHYAPAVSSRKYLVRREGKRRMFTYRSPSSK